MPLRPGTFICVCFLLLGSGVLGAQNRTEVPLPLPVPKLSQGSAFNTTNQTLEPHLLCGLILSVQSPYLAVAPLTAALKADGSLDSIKNEPWQGTIPSRILRLEKSGCILGGLRLLFIVQGTGLRIQQIQPFWYPFSGGGIQGQLIPGKVVGKPAGDKDQTLVKEIMVPDGYWPIGLHGLVEGRKLTQFSLVVKPLNKPSIPLKSPPAPNAAKSSLPGFIKAPQEPQAPTVKLAQ